MSNSCVSGTLWDTGNTLFLSKEKDTSYVPLSFLELWLVNHNSNEDGKDDDDNIIKNVYLCGSYYVLPGTALKLLQQALDKCLLSGCICNLLCNTRLVYMCPKDVFSGRICQFSLFA